MPHGRYFFQLSHDHAADEPELNRAAEAVVVAGYLWCLQSFGAGLAGGVGAGEGDSEQGPQGDEHEYQNPDPHGVIVT